MTHQLCVMLDYMHMCSTIHICILADVNSMHKLNLQLQDLNIYNYSLIGLPCTWNMSFNPDNVNTVRPVYYGHLGTNYKCLIGVLTFQVNLYDKAPFGTITT